MNSNPILNLSSWHTFEAKRGGTYLIYGDGKMNSDLIMMGLVIADRDNLDEDLTLAGHAELWAKGNGIEVPERGTDEWNEMYEQWIDWAFADFRA